ncbi:MFS transporter [Desulfocicer vacuolatum]|nr:MFS transporter [Desulfocicer vacuolatum]
MMKQVKSNILRLYIIKISKWLMLTMPIVFLFYRENGLATQDLFVLKAVYSASIVIMEVPSGYFGDMWGRKKSLILGSCLGFLGFLLYSFSSGFWGFLLCEIVLGVGQSFISGSDSAILYDTLLWADKEKQYLKIEGRLISLGNFAEAIAAPIGVLLAAVSLRTTFYCQTLVAFSAIPAALYLFEPHKIKKSQQRAVGHIFSIINYALVQNRALKWNIIFSSVMGTATLTMAWFVQPYLVFISIPLALYGVIIPILNMTTGITAMHAHRLEKKMGMTWTVFFIAASIGCGYIGLGLCHTAWGVLALCFFYVFRGIATPVLRNYINEITPSEIRATVLSVRSLAIRLSFVFVGPVIGWQADISGVPYTLYISGALVLLAGGWSALMLVREQKEKGEIPHLIKDVQI